MSTFCSHFDLRSRWCLQGVSGSRSRPQLLLSTLVRFVRCLLGLITMLVRRDLRKDAELLVISTYADTNASVACFMSTDMPRDMPG